MRRTSSNPVFKRASTYDYVADRPVTYANVAFKTILLLGIALLSATISLLNLEFIANNWYLVIVAMVVAFISVFVGTMSVRLAPTFSVIYAIAEGLVLGMVSAIYMVFVGDAIVPTALGTTLIVFLAMLLLYSTNIIKVDKKFVTFMMVALIGVMISSLLSFLIIGEVGILIIIISALLSAFFLLIDFQRIKDFVESGTDQRVGWILALGLMVTIVWIYVEMLRILAIFAKKN